MPNKYDKIPINDPKLDRRVKLSEEDKKKIQREYVAGGISINGLARKYKVSKRLIQFTLFPERKEKAKKMFAERQKDGRYYDKEAHTKSVREHREYKKELLEKGLLSEGRDSK